MDRGAFGYPIVWPARLTVWRIGGLGLFLLCLWAGVAGAMRTDDASPQASRPDSPPPVSVQASVDQAEVSIGDRI